MKQFVRYQFLLIPGKLRGEIRITIDDTRAAEFSSEFNGNKSTNITFLPIISLTIVKPSSVDDNGNRVKGQWTMSDTLGMTKFNLPLFLRQIKAMQENMKIPDLYTYQGKRLELNEEKAEKIRDVFPIGNVTIELSAVVITQVNAAGEDERIEGIKIKFNNEQSSVVLSINEFDSLVYNVEHIDVDSIAFLVYLNYIKSSDKPKTFTQDTLKPLVDIVPKEEDFD